MSRNVKFVRKLHLERRVLNSEVVNRSVLITCSIPKNRKPIPIVLKSSMIMIPPEPNYEEIRINGFYEKIAIGNLFNKCNKMKKIAFYNGMLPALRCKDENPLQQPFGAESAALTEDEPPKQQPEDIGRSPDEECEWEEEEDYEDEEDDQ